MAIITFLSDFGEKDHYAAAVKASILAKSPTQQIVDISHQINRHDISHAAYVIKSVFQQFPKGTVHLISVNPVTKRSARMVAVEIDGHFFVAHDSGIFNLISSTPIGFAVELPPMGNTFETRSVLGPIAARLAKGESLQSVGNQAMNLEIKMDRQLKATKREMVGQVIHIDHYGNLITNINKTDFDNICKLNGGTPGYTVRFSREVFTQLHTQYSDVEDGDCFVLFNSDGLLEIGINKGRASELLGLRKDALVSIEFNQ